MERAVFASGDFGKVSAQLQAEQCGHLLHADVLNSATRDDAFSEERKHLVRVVDVPSRTLSMTLGGLNPGQATRMHRHNYETIIYVISGQGASQIEGRDVSWRAGDAFYIPTWAWHRHMNRSESERVLYIACENAPMLQNLGIALREEA